jgi:hypothetical protein
MSDRAWMIVILITWLAIAMEYALRRWERRRIKRALLHTLNRFRGGTFVRGEPE